jgi:peptidylprolyl isomerase
MRPRLFLVAALPATLLFAASCGGDDDDATPTAAASSAASPKPTTAEKSPATAASTTSGAIVLKNPTTTASGLKYEDIVVGTGATAAAGKTVSVTYVGTFVSGKKFDASADHGGAPFTFILGQGQVIKGWDEGVAGMKVGGKRYLEIPPDLGYGPRDYQSIPGGSTLLFEVNLVAVK